METSTVFILFVIFLAFVFDFTNGFHDAGNSIATIVATEVLTPLQAVMWAAFFNLNSAVELRRIHPPHL